MRSVKGVVSDVALRDAVHDEIEWDPRTNASRITVDTKDGAVSLTGSVTSYWQRLAAVRAAQRVRGVKAVADDIQVVLSEAVTRKDAQIATEIAHERSRSTAIPDSVTIEVSKGRVALRGHVERSVQRDEAARAVRHLQGVRSVSNLIEVKDDSEARAS